MLEFYTPPKSPKPKTGIFCFLVHEARPATELELPGGENVFVIKAVNKREYMLAANHKEEMDEWLVEIRKCMEEDQGSTSQSSPSVSGSEERGAEAALLPSPSADVIAVANTSVAAAKLGKSQSLRVRMDSYPADKKSAEAVTSLAKRRNVYTPSTLQINSRSSGSFSSPHHGPQTPTFKRIYLAVVLLPNCLQGHPPVQRRHLLFHLINLIFCGRFPLKRHRNQVVKITQFGSQLLLKITHLQITHGSMEHYPG
ncbi:signal transducer [Desmophyllum pertusum]|uniref:Signal transducer n=1 Tax=Desmophyllum pertusum TaxID=174260 RepID=A0A9W9Z6Z9_9CNID|nr:signal transducer [Desmophyllum pertusum]